MSPFVQDIIEYFEKYGVTYDFSSKDQLLKSERVNIQLLANISDPRFSVNTLKSPKNYLRIWEDQYLQHAPIIYSRIKSILGLNERIYARETFVTAISQKEFDVFVGQNHLNLSTNAKYRYSLMQNDKIVAVAGFGRSCPIDFRARTYKSNELIRFCSLKGYTVVGGLSKLLHHFINVYEPEHIMTYIDKEWSTGDNFIKLGFEIIASTPPEMFAISPDDGKRYRLNELARFKSTDDWQKVSNLGNLKLIKLIIPSSHE